jgi:tetratricopeptide (TPR) repeat protein
VKNVYLQKALTPAVLIMARFGRWNEIIQVPAPDQKFQYALGIWHYARGVAEVELNQIDVANTDLASLKKITLQGPIDKNMGKFGQDLLMIALNVLQGIIANKAGHTDNAINYFQTAIQLQDAIYSADPPPWYFPVRQLLGAVFLQHARPLEAKRLFQQDLIIYPHNGWSLYGLMQSHLALGEKAAADHIGKQFSAAWQHADIEKPVYPL